MFSSSGCSMHRDVKSPHVLSCMRRDARFLRATRGAWRACCAQLLVSSLESLGHRGVMSVVLGVTSGKAPLFTLDEICIAVHGVGVVLFKGELGAKQRTHR